MIWRETFKRLTHFTPEFRLGVGNYRVLFEVEGAKWQSIAYDIERTLTRERTSMIELHPEIIEKDGKEFVILSYEEFLAIDEALADAEDLTELRAAKKELDARVFL
ncbi:MAG TPA: hypothetical protein VGO56_02220 [Pyrinomonadaceae bacterium]|jgi:hypothetical protein|nr:hypothetical protein [Pyrinomonadaceae bacterium]